MSADTVSKNPKQATNSKPIPHIPLPFEEVMRDVLKVKPPTRELQKRQKTKSRAMTERNQPKA
jgi:hypothetical protein